MVKARSESSDFSCELSPGKRSPGPDRCDGSYRSLVPSRLSWSHDSVPRARVCSVPVSPLVSSSFLPPLPNSRRPVSQKSKRNGAGDIDWNPASNSEGGEGFFVGEVQRGGPQVIGEREAKEKLRRRHPTPLQTPSLVSFAQSYFDPCVFSSCCFVSFRFPTPLSGNWGVDSQAGSEHGFKLLFIPPPRLSLNTADHWVSRLDPPFRCRLLLYNRSKHTVYRRLVLYPLHALAEITTVTTGSLAPQWVSSCCSRNFHCLRVSSLPLVMFSSSYWLVIPSGGN